MPDTILEREFLGLEDRQEHMRTVVAMERRAIKHDLIQPGTDQWVCPCCDGVLDDTEGEVVNRTNRHACPCGHFHAASWEFIYV